MSFYLNYDDKIVKAHEPLVTSANRGFRYGDGLFETMKMIDGHIHFLPEHLERIYDGMRLLSFELPDYFTPAFLENKITELTVINGHSLAARVRLMVFRGEGTLYGATDMTPHYLIESFPLIATPEIPELTIGIYKDARKAIDSFSHIKSNNYQPYLLGAIHARKMGWGDSIILNTSGAVCESTIANLFIIKSGIIITPPLNQGCIAGIMRKHLLKQLPSMDFKVMEDTILPEMLHDADEVFLTNSIQGIRIVHRMEEIDYTNSLTTKIKDALSC